LQGAAHPHRLHTHRLRRRWGVEEVRLRQAWLMILLPHRLQTHRLGRRGGVEVVRLKQARLVEVSRAAGAAL